MAAEAVQVSKNKNIPSPPKSPMGSRTPKGRRGSMAVKAPKTRTPETPGKLRLHPSPSLLVPPSPQALPWTVPVLPVPRNARTGKRVQFEDVVSETVIAPMAMPTERLAAEVAIPSVTVSEIEISVPMEATLEAGYVSNKKFNYSEKIMEKTAKETTAKTVESKETTMKPAEIAENQSEKITETSMDDTVEKKTENALTKPHKPDPTDQKVDPIARLVDAMAVRLRRRQIVGSRNVALATATLVQNVVKTAKFATINDLIRILHGVAEALNQANPKEVAAGNIIRRIIKLIREEYSAAVVAHLSQPGTPAPATPSPVSDSYPPTSYFDVNAPKQLRLSDFVAARHVKDQLERSGSSTLLDFSGRTREMEREFERQAAKLKPVLIQAIDEVINEIETTHEDVARGAKEHIHSSEVILTLGHSKTVEAFLKAAFRDRKFTVIVLESAPSFLGQPMAAALANNGIPTLLVPDSSLHAVMPRVTKVIFGAHSVSANGGLISLAGSLACALAARTHAKPVVVTTGQFKFAPSWNLAHGFDVLDFQGPGPVIGYDDGGAYENVDVVDPHYDYVRPELVNLYVTNVGDHPPSYIYRITKEAYDEDTVEGQVC